MGSKVVKNHDAAFWTKQLEDGKGKYEYGFDPWEIEFHPVLKDMKFHRVILYMTGCTKEKFEDFLQKWRKVITDVEEKVNGQIHVLDRKNPLHLNWGLEELAARKGLVCNQQIPFPWGGRKGGNEYSIVTFGIPEKEK
ncbi:hypothetical protein Hdeb2414_s0004g00148311 [Helianthus debilis subsp. tardiflorus]